MTEVKIVRTSDIARCPKQSLLPSHYRDDGSCRCERRGVVVHVRNDSANGREVERAQGQMRNWHEAGYAVGPVPSDGREHSYDLVCLSCTDFEDALREAKDKGLARCCDAAVLASFCQEDLQLLIGAVSPKLVWQGAMRRGLTLLEVATMCDRAPADAEALQW